MFIDTRETVSIQNRNNFYYYYFLFDHFNFEYTVIQRPITFITIIIFYCSLFELQVKVRTYCTLLYCMTAEILALRNYVSSPYTYN